MHGSTVGNKATERRFTMRYRGTMDCAGIDDDCRENRILTSQYVDSFGGAGSERAGKFDDFLGMITDQRRMMKRRTTEGELTET